MSQETTENTALLTALQQCGHFLHHRWGGKCSQIRILRILYEKKQLGDSLSQLELQQMLGIRSGSISEIIGKLEAGGLICKTRQEGDRRRICLTLTEAGCQAFLQECQTRRQMDSRLFVGLTDAEQEQLSALLQKLLESWKEQFGPEQLSRPHHNPPGGASC